MSESGVVSSGRLNIARVRGILFDVDGTLSDTDDHMVNRLIRTMKPVSWLFRQHNPKHFARWLVMAMETPANLIYGLADKVGLDNLFAKFYNKYSQNKRRKKLGQRNFILIPGTQEMLENLAGVYPLGIVSARDALTTKQFLESFNLAQYFDVVVTAQTCAHTKPYPDPVICAADSLGLSPDECVMVGDTIVDVRAGKLAGAQTIGVLCGFGTHKELERADADLILQDTPKIIGLFD
jgi:HAD superfamily hydrolase (TIGR01549 family)